MKIFIKTTIRRLIETVKCQMFYRKLNDIRHKSNYLKVDDMNS